MARRRHSRRRRRRGGFTFLYKLLSVLVICGVIVAALTLFFRVDAIVVTGQRTYTEAEIQAAAGVEIGDNLYLLNKHEVAARIVKTLPYIESIRINRKLPDTLLISVQECSRPMALVQDGYTWLISCRGKIVEQLAGEDSGDYGRISGCQLLAPSVGEAIALATEYAAQQTSLLGLLTALEDAAMLDHVDNIRLDELSYINMDYAGRFTVRLPYGGDYDRELWRLSQSLESGKIQENVSGILDLQADSEKAYFIPNLQ